MRPLEIVIPCILAVYLLWPLITGKSWSKLANYLPLAALLATILHLTLEKYRWENGTDLCARVGKQRDRGCGPAAAAAG